MRRWHIRGVAALVAVAGVLGLPSAYAAVTVGAVAAMTGPQAGAARVYWQNVRLWASRVNHRGGLRLKSGAEKVKLVAYDDRSDIDRAIGAVGRFGRDHKADFVIPPYDPGFDLAAAAAFRHYGYPEIAATVMTGRSAALARIYPDLFFLLGKPASYVDGVLDVAEGFHRKGWIGNKVAMVHVDDALGLELDRIAEPLFTKAGFDIAYKDVYPLGTDRLRPVIDGAKKVRPDAFIAWSDPGDTTGLVEMARREELVSPIFYTAFGTSSPAFGRRFGKGADAVLGAGGVDRDTPAMKAYLSAYRAFAGAPADGWTGPVVYASCQILGQAIDAVGSTDRAAVTAYIAGHRFRTVVGPVVFAADHTNPAFWTVGQWQDGKYVGVGAVGLTGAKPVRIKSGWWHPAIRATVASETPRNETKRTNAFGHASSHDPGTGRG